MTEMDERQLAYEITALLVHDHSEHLARFEESLRLHGVELTHAHNCEEASQALHQPSCPAPADFHRHPAFRRYLSGHSKAGSPSRKVRQRPGGFENRE